MPRLKPDTQRARRSHILDAAELCFARAGFHRTTMQDICKEAGVSPGALYVYFDSKEALIEGIVERNRAEFAELFNGLAAAPDFLAALHVVGQRYFSEEPPHKRLMCIEIGVEATRNARVGRIWQSVDAYVRESFHVLFQRLQDERRIDPLVPIPALVEAFSTIGDGLFWRRAVDPTFDPAVALPAVIRMFGGLLRPVEGAPAETRTPATEATS